MGVVRFGRRLCIDGADPGTGSAGLVAGGGLQAGGADLIIVTGTSKDAKRLEIARKLGADHTIDVQTENPLERIMQITGGKGVDVALDCTAGAGTSAVLLGVVALKRKAGTLLIQGEMADFPNFQIGKVTVKYITIKSARGHSYHACELALQQLASHRFPLEMVTTHTFGLADADTAIKAVVGGYSPDVIHVSLLPWN